MGLIAAFALRKYHESASLISLVLVSFSDTTDGSRAHLVPLSQRPPGPQPSPNSASAITAPESPARFHAHGSILPARRTLADGGRGIWSERVESERTS